MELTSQMIAARMQELQVALTNAANQHNIILGRIEEMKVLLQVVAQAESNGESVSAPEEFVTEDAANAELMPVEVAAE